MAGVGFPAKPVPARRGLLGLDQVTVQVTAM